MKRRIMLLSFYLDLGGSERQLTEIARALDRAKYAVHIGCGETGGLRSEELKAAGIPIKIFPMRSFLSAGAFRQGLRLMSYVRQENIDLVHAFDVPMDVFGVPAARLARGFGKHPVVLSSQRAHRSLTAGPRLQVLRMTDRIADGVIVNCEFIRRHLIDDEGVPPDKVHLCYNGLELSAFPFREARGNTFGCVCALRPEKNLSLLIQAFGAVRRKEPDARLLLVGSGPMKNGLQELVSELGLGEAITFIPSTPDVAQWLHKIDIFVLPSTTEAFSNALMEAMACGCAVIASDVGGNPELTGDGERGLLFPSGDVQALANTMLHLLSNSDSRVRLAHAARGFVESRLSMEASAQRMSQIYEGFLSNK